MRGLEETVVPTFEKLSEAEVQKLGKRRAPALDLSEYVTFLDTLKVGDWGRISLAEGESQRTVKRRLTMASKQRGVTVKYRRSPEGQVLFQIQPAS